MRHGRGVIFMPTEESRLHVEELVCFGMSHEDIAKALGIARNTLLKHFADELANGRPRRRAELARLSFEAARKGNFSAIKRLEEIAVGPRVIKGRPAGKKEIAAVEAVTAGENSQWGDDLQIGVPPTLN